MDKVKAVVNELVKRFSNNGFNPITVTMKCNGEKVYITPCVYSDDKTSVSLSDVEYFLVECSLPWLSCEKIEELAEKLVNFKKYLDEAAEGKSKLEKYFNERIKGHTSEELELGNQICLKAYDWYKDVPEDKKTNYIFDKSLDDYYINRYRSENPSYSVETLKKAYDLANDFSCYSDWYKDEFGYRPRSLDTFERTSF